MIYIHIQTLLPSDLYKTMFYTIKDAQIARGHPAKKAVQTQLIPAGR